MVSSLIFQKFSGEGLTEPPPQTPPPLLPSHQIITNDFSWKWQLNHFVSPFQIIASNMHQNEWFQVWFFKNFLGRGSPSPLPRPLPPLFLGLRPRFGLRPQFSGASRPRLGLRPRYSGASRPRFGLRPQLSIGDLGLAPQNKFLDPPLFIFNSTQLHLHFKRHLHLKWPVVHQQLHVIRNTAHRPSTQASYTASRVRPKRKISCAAAQIAATQIAATLTISFPRWRHMSLMSYWGQQRMSLTSYPRLKLNQDLKINKLDFLK